MGLANRGHREHRCVIEGLETRTLLAATPAEHAPALPETLPGIVWQSNAGSDDFSLTQIASGRAGRSYHLQQNGTLTSYSRKGVVIWSKNVVPGGASNVAAGLALDRHGNLYVGGTAYMRLDAFSEGGFDDRFEGRTDGFLMKLSRTGEQIWSSYIGGRGDENVNGMTLDAAGKVWLVGHTSDRGWVPESRHLDRKGSGFGVKVSSDGKLLFAQAGGTLGAYSAVSADRHGGVYLLGPEPVSFGTTRLVHWSAAGEVLWKRDLGGDRGASIWSLAVGPSGHLFVGGLTWSNQWEDVPLINQRQAMDYEPFVMKLDAAGTPQWLSHIGARDEGRVWSIAPDAYGNVLVSGDLSDGDFGAGSGNDGYLAKFDAVGRRRWATYVNPYTGDALGNSIALDPNQNILLSTGFTFVSNQKVFKLTQVPSAVTIEEVRANLRLRYGKVQMTADATGDVQQVEFYADADGDGVVDPEDVPMGVDKSVRRGWRLTAPAEIVMAVEGIIATAIGAGGERVEVGTSVSVPEDDAPAVSVVLPMETGAGALSFSMFIRDASPLDRKSIGDARVEVVSPDGEVLTTRHAWEGVFNGGRGLLASFEIRDPDGQLARGSYTVRFAGQGVRDLYWNATAGDVGAFILPPI